MPRSPSHPTASLSRRDFLRVAGAGLGAFALPHRLLTFTPFDDDGFITRTGPSAQKPVDAFDDPAGRRGAATSHWPELSLDSIPAPTAQMLAALPRLAFDASGYLILSNIDGRPQGQVPLVPTQWNRENSRPVTRMNTRVPWGIVLHWFGDKEGFPGTVKAYMNGFDSLRPVLNYVTRTSAHFLVGREVPFPAEKDDGSRVGILQTQAPDKDGIPFIASHLTMPDYQAHAERKQYFVRALYQLNKSDPGVHSLLQDVFDGRVADPNYRTIGIEICGYDFENPARAPSPVQVANVVSLVWAIMKRYGIRASNILGHQEFQLSKPDPGKKFTALIRYLVGVKALVEPDARMKELVFGQFLAPDGDPQKAVGRYFKFLRDYQVMISTPRRVYEWESECQYWPFYDQVCGSPPLLRPARKILTPLESPVWDGYGFLSPNNHEGLDLYPQDRENLATLQPSAVHLAADGLCLFIGESSGTCKGKTAIFRHRQANGTEVATVFSHLSEIGDLQVGKVYPQGAMVGQIRNAWAWAGARHRSFLHFATAYGATWETALRLRPTIPLNAGETWIQDHYLSPMEYLKLDA